MDTFDRILIPTDFSDNSGKAYSLSQKFASSWGAVIDMIHIIPDVVHPDELIRSKANMPDPETDLYSQLLSDAEQQLNKTMEQFITPENRGEIYVKADRKPSEVIADHASEGSYSMIIMSARGKHDSGMFRGSTTEQIVRRSKVPVLTVDEQMDIEELKTILVPSDGSLLSMAAIPAALKLAGTLGSSITMLYVNEMYGLISNHFSAKNIGYKNQEIIEHLVHRLKEFADETGKQFYHLSEKTSRKVQHISTELNGREVTIPIYFEIITGFSAHHEITQYANKSADIVVMTTHGRSGLAHLLMGSNAEKVALNVEKPVLTIRPDAKLFSII